MQRDDGDKNNVLGCATEILEGSAYQSWDWRNGAEVGIGFQKVDLADGQPWQNVEQAGADFSIPALEGSGPWASGLQAGDSLWHQTAWDCRTRLDTIGQYDTVALHELDWFWLRPGTWQDGFIFGDWSWNKVYSNNTDVMKIAEANRFVLTTFEEDGLIFADPSWLHTKAPHVDSVKFLEHTRIVFTRNFNEGFFKLVELDWLVVDTPHWDAFILSDDDFVKVYSNNADSAIYVESIWNNSIKALVDAVHIYELVEKFSKTFEEDYIQIFDFSYLKTYLNNSDYIRFVELLKIIFTRNFNEGFFKFVEENWFDTKTSYDEEFKFTESDWLKTISSNVDICKLVESVWTSMRKVFAESIKVQELVEKICNVPEGDESIISENNYYKTYLNNLDRAVLIELLRIVFTRNFNEGFFKLVESLNFEITALKLDNIKIVENIQNFLEVGFTDALKIYEVLALETITAVAEIFKLSDSSFLETHSNNGDNGKLTETISLTIFSGGGYGIGGYGVLGYGV